MLIFSRAFWFLRYKLSLVISLRRSPDSILFPGNRVTPAVLFVCLRRFRRGLCPADLCLHPIAAGPALLQFPDARRMSVLDSS